MESSSSDQEVNGRCTNMLGKEASRLLLTKCTNEVQVLKGRWRWQLAGRRLGSGFLIRFPVSACVPVSHQTIYGTQLSVKMPRCTYISIVCRQSR
eukprot:scaffold14356_cov194-Skeletonema_marinoi.AAC.7